MNPDQNQQTPWIKAPGSKKSRLVYAVVLLVVLLLACGLFWQIANRSQPEPGISAESISAEELQSLEQAILEIGENQRLIVNGELKVNGAFVLGEKEEPTNPQAGEIYFRSTTDSILYYDGTKFIELATNNNICYVGAADSCGFTTTDGPVTNNITNVISGGGSSDSLTTSTNFSGNVIGRYNSLEIIANSVGATEIQNSSVENADLANSSLTVNAGNGLTGGGTVSLGGSVSLQSSLGSLISSSEIEDDAILATDLNNVAAPGAGQDGYSLTYDHATGGFEWVATSGGGGITSLNGLLVAAQTFATSTTGTDFTVSSAGSTHTFNLPNASPTARGLINTGAQILAGVKTFSSNVILNSTLQVDGNTILGDGVGDSLVVNGSTITLAGFDCSANDNSGTLTVNGSGVLSCTDDDGGDGVGVTSFNGLTASTQTFVDDTNLTVVSAGPTHTITWSGQLAVTRGGTGAGTQQGAINNLSGLTTQGDLLYYNGSNSVRLAMGVDGQCLTSNTTTILWGSCGSSTATLQAAYDVGNTITTSDARNIAVTLADTATDANLLVNIASGSTGRFAVQDNGSDIFAVNTAGINLGVNTTLAAGRTLRIVGDVVANLPSGTDGQIYYANDTDDLYIYNGSNAVWDKLNKATTATFVVAASDSLDKSGADYVADGTADEVQINAAITAANTAGGGLVYLMDGTYNVSTSVILLDDVSVQGAGDETVVQFANSTNPTSDDEVFEGGSVSTSVHDVVLRDLVIDANDDGQTNDNVGGIEVYAGSGSGTGALRGINIQNIKILDTKAYAMDLNGSDHSNVNNIFVDCNNASANFRSIDISGGTYIHFSNSRVTDCGIAHLGADNSTFVNNHFSNIGNTAVGGVDLSAGTLSTFSDNIVEDAAGSGVTTGTDNTITGNVITGSSHGIVCSSENNVTINSNIIRDNLGDGIRLAGSCSDIMISDNHLIANADSGVYIANLSGNNNISIIGNNIDTNDIGIESFLSGPHHMNMSNNVIRGNALNGIALSSADTTLVQGNRFYDNGGSPGSSATLSIAGDNNRIIGNYFYDSGGTSNFIAIGSGADNTYLADNTFDPASVFASEISDVSSTTIYSSQWNPANVLRSDAAQFTSSRTTTFPGSINPTASTAVTGVGTTFTTELGVGDQIIVSGETRTVVAIASNTSLTVNTAFSDTANDTSLEKISAALAVRNTSTSTYLAVTSTGSIYTPSLASCTGLTTNANGLLACGTATSLQSAYTSSTTPEITLDATRGAVTIRDNATPIGANLFEVQNNGGTVSYMSVTSTGTTLVGDLNIASIGADSTTRVISSRFNSNIGGVSPGTIFQTDQTNESTFLAVAANGTGTQSGFLLHGAGAASNDRAMVYYDEAGSGTLHITAFTGLSTESGDILLRTEAVNQDITTRLQIDDEGNISANPTGTDSDFSAAGDTDMQLLYVNAGTDRVGISTNNPSATFDVAGDTFLEEELILGVDSRTIASSGDGNPAALTLLPTSSYVEISCNDTDGCDVTMSESSPITRGQMIYIVSLSANALNFADTGGITELAGAFVAGQYDTISLIYASDRWVEYSRSDN